MTPFYFSNRTFRWNGDILEEAAWFTTHFPIQHALEIVALPNDATYNIPGVPGAALRWENDQLLSRLSEGPFEFLGWERSHIQTLIDEYKRKSV